MLSRLDRLPKRFARALLGPARYARLRALLQGTSSAPPAPPIDHALRARLKSHIIESLGRQRALEKELARLKHPELYRESLDVTAEIATSGDLPSDDAATVSVVVTNFNYGRYLSLALGSIFAQTHRCLEALVVDDGSSDGSAEGLRRILGDGCPVPYQRVLLKHNVGLPAARNLGVRLARGRYVFILDADNHLLADCLARHVETALATAADATYAKIRTFGGSAQLLSAAPFSSERLASEPYIDAMALFRRSALIEAGLYSQEPLLHGWEDYELWVRFAAQGRSVAFIPRVLSHYRSHPQSMIAVTNLDTRSARLYLSRTYPTVFADAGSRRRADETGAATHLVVPGSGPFAESDEDPAACACTDSFEEPPTPE